MINSYIYLSLGDKKKIKLTLTFKRINYLKTYKNDYYLEMMRILSSNDIDVCDVIKTIYISYLCANNNTMNFEDFVKEIDNNYSIGDLNVITTIYADLIFAKNNKGFREPFEIRTTKSTKSKIPKFELEDIEDYYTYYVLVLKISEDVFWNADYSFLNSVLKNKLAYDNYINSEREKEMKRNSRK